jgi:GNAT superfamily N-acetyltransferase
MTELLIREGTRSDIEATQRAKLAIHRECYPFRGEEAFRLVEAGIPTTVKFWEAGMDLGMRFHVAVLPTTGEIVGMSGGRPTNRDEDPNPALPDTELQMCYLAAEYRGTGAADRLIAAVIGERPAHLWVLEGNERAVAFYAKHGFQLTGDREQLDETWANRWEVRMVRR